MHVHGNSWYQCLVFLSLCLSRSSFLSFFALFFSCISGHVPSPAAAACGRACFFLTFSLALFIFSLCMCILVYIYLSLSFSVSPPLSLYENENTTLNSRMNSKHGHQLPPLLGASVYGPTCFEARARTSTFLSCHEQSFRGTTDERGRH
jgi:hypothetical protein